MFEYIVGKINYLNNSYLILENNFIGYKIWINNPDTFEKNKTVRLYIFTKISQTNKGNYAFEYYGFKSVIEKIFFECLIAINGIGPKTALVIMKNDLSLLKELIRNDDIVSLEMLPGFNNKIATMVCSQLGYKFRNENVNDKSFATNTGTGDVLTDVIAALKALGYKKQEIEIAINKISSKIDTFDKNDISTIISEAIKVILGNEESTTIKT